MGKYSYKQTVYFFLTGDLYEVRQPSDKQFTYVTFIDIGLTLDHTGQNLPKNRKWRFAAERQGGQDFRIALDDEYERIWKALDEKGWFLTRLVTRMGIESEDAITQSAQDLLAELLKEP